MTFVQIMKIIIIFILLIIPITFLGCTNQEDNIITPDDPWFLNIDLCENNLDCIIVDYDSCCSSKLAINKKYLKFYETVLYEKPKFYENLLYKKDLDKRGSCSLVSCIIRDENKLAVVCKKFEDENINRCRLIETNSIDNK